MQQKIYLETPVILIFQYDDEEDTEGYSEGNEEFSCGIELPTQDDKSSGNVTPIPTTGELEEISVEEGTSTEERRNPSGERRNKSAPPNIDQGSPPRTPLKSLLKKPSLDIPDDQGNILSIFIIRFINNKFM